MERTTTDIDHIDFEFNGKTLSADTTVTKLNGKTIKVAFNATVTETGRAGQQQTTTLSHEADSQTSVSIDQAMKYYGMMIDTFKKSGRLSIH